MTYADQYRHLTTLLCRSPAGAAGSPTQLTATSRSATSASRSGNTARGPSQLPHTAAWARAGWPTLRVPLRQPLARMHPNIWHFAKTHIRTSGLLTWEAEHRHRSAEQRLFGSERYLSPTNSIGRHFGSPSDSQSAEFASTIARSTSHTVWPGLLQSRDDLSRRSQPILR